MNSTPLSGCHALAEREHAYPVADIHVIVESETRTGGTVEIVERDVVEFSS